MDERNGSGWDAAGLGGTAAALDGPVGMSSAYWTGANAILLLATNASMQLSVSTDKIHFDTVAEPIILYDDADWKRPAPTDLYAYPSMMSEQGFNTIAGRFFLTYTYLRRPGFSVSATWSCRKAASVQLRHRGIPRCGRH